MALPRNCTLVFDASGVAICIVWLFSVVRFLLDTPFLELPDEQPKIMFFAFWLTCHMYHFAIMFRQKRIAYLQDCFQAGRFKLRNRVLESNFGICTRYFLEFLQTKRVSMAGNAILEAFITSCTALFALKGGIALYKGSDPTFYFQNFMCLLLYCAVAVRFYDFYNVQKLIIHFCYACIHAGYCGEYLNYEGSYVVFNTGILVSSLLVMWHFLDFKPCVSPSQSPSHGDPLGRHSPRDNVPQVEQPKDDENSPRHLAPSPPSKDSRWKPKQKKKRRR